MNNLIKFSIFAAMNLSLFGGANAEHSGGEGMLSGFEKTGESVMCISLTQLRNTDPIDANAILFKLRNGNTYLNEVRGSCLDLTRNRRFSFKTSQNRICKGDLILIANSVGTEMGSCDLGSFEKLSELNERSE